jgi:putative tryptophan/tyrosine transport system substrate-binding protein
MKRVLFLAGFAALMACNGDKKNVPVVGFLDFVNDETLERAKTGFFDALKDSGYDEKAETIKIIYRNAQGDQPALVQATDYLLSQKVDLIAANTTLSTITAVQRSKNMPVCMMVAPRPDLAGLQDKNGKNPGNLFGVYETLEYIDTALSLIPAIIPKAKKVGTIYSQSEPQSIDALNRIKAKCSELGLTLEAIPVTNSAETQLVTQSLLSKDIDVFFALPDNIIFSSFETVVKTCTDKKIPVFTSEAGLVKRGALCAFGADMYAWGYQAGRQAVEFIKTRQIPPISKVNKRVRVYNPDAAETFKIQFDKSFSKI